MPLAARALCSHEPLPQIKFQHYRHSVVLRSCRVLIYREYVLDVQRHAATARSLITIRASSVAAGPGSGDAMRARSSVGGWNCLRFHVSSSDAARRWPLGVLDDLWFTLHGFVQVCPLQNLPKA